MTPEHGCVTPESEVARRIAIIGDMVEEEFGDRLKLALSDVMSLPREEVTYDVMRRIAEQDGLMSSEISTWKQVKDLKCFILFM